MIKLWKAFRAAFISLLATGAFGLACWQVFSAQRQAPLAQPPVTPPSSPFGDTVAASGIAEPRTENISVGTHIAAVVTEVAVKVGQRVAAGDLLFRVDDRQTRADLQVREAMLAAAETQLKRLENMPRPEEIPASLAKVREARANLDAATDHLNRGRRLLAGKVITDDDFVTLEQTFQTAKEQLSRAQADHDLLMAGSWEPDKIVSRAAVVQARAEVEQTRTELERLSVRALVAGEVLQVNVRPGEYVATPASQALIVLGDVRELHVRVDVDEHDIPRFVPGVPARAMVRGDQRDVYELSFVRVEPYVIPKKSLTGDNTERVDTRVLQVIYALKPGKKPVYVGQQMDVFIDISAAPPPAATRSTRPEPLAEGAPAAVRQISAESAAEVER